MTPDLAKIPDFLRRNPKGPDMTQTPAQASIEAENPPTPAPAKTKTRRRDCYICRATISIPLNMADAESLSAAIKAADAIEASLPPGSKVTFASRGLGKV
jgi:hypothetical protein